MSFSPLTERLEYFARRAVPLGFLTALLMLNLVGITLPYIGLIHAQLFLIGVYYWSIYRPTLLPAWLVFVFAGTIDLIGSYPLGLNMLVLVLVRWIVTEQRRFLMAQTFAMLWLGYGVVALSHMLIMWALLSTLSLHIIPVLAPLASTFLGVMLFPPIYVLLLGTHKFLPKALGGGYLFKSRT